METLRRLHSLSRPATTKVLWYVIDGVGGVPHPEHGHLTELEAARIPALDRFAVRACCGRTLPFGWGVAPGSGPGHLALFGYPNDQIELNRGVLEVLGAEKAYQGGSLVAGGYHLQRGDVTARGNWVSVEPSSWIVADRRAGSGLDDAQNEEMARELSAKVRIDGVQVTFFPGKGHRFAVALRGEGLGASLTDADPQREGAPVAKLEGLGTGDATRTIEAVEELMRQVHELLGPRSTINFGLLRGIGGPPELPTLPELYGLRCACLATYPMYRGIARLVGMDIVECHTHEEQVTQLERHFDDFDFFYLHIKETDSYAHLGDFRGKVGVLEEIDPLFGRCAALPFDVIAVTGDHSTPSLLLDHSYHPVPTMLWSRGCLADDVQRYSEREVYRGSLGTLDARHLLPIALAEAGRFIKFGA
jgi:2,3-bisphosphoglycerate-independent phosphoglycerate mutase